MNKADAIRITNRSHSNGICNLRNSRFAKVNSAKAVWWFDIPLALIERRNGQDIHLLCYDQHMRELHHLQVPTAYFLENQLALATRNQGAKLSLELLAEGISIFRDARGTGRLSFSQFMCKQCA